MPVDHYLLKGFNPVTFSKVESSFVRHYFHTKTEWTPCRNPRQINTIIFHLKESLTDTLLETMDWPLPHNQLNVNLNVWKDDWITELCHSVAVQLPVTHLSFAGILNVKPVLHVHFIIYVLSYSSLFGFVEERNWTVSWGKFGKNFTLNLTCYLFHISYYSDLVTVEVYQAGHVISFFLFHKHNSFFHLGRYSKLCSDKNLDHTKTGECL